MKKVILIFLYSLSVNFSSQNITVIYEGKYKSNSNKDYYSNELFYLDIFDKESIFRSDRDRQSDSLIEKTGYGLGFKMSYNNQFYVKKSLSKKEVNKIISTPFFSDIYSLSIDEILTWSVFPDKLNYGRYDCQKARLFYGGRNWTAWFTQTIPIQDGPYIFNGLPGLIVKISDDNSDYEFNLIEVKNEVFSYIPPLKPKNKIEWETLKKLEIAFYNDPYSEVKVRNIRYKNVDQNGNPISINLKQMTENIQRNIRDNNNHIELNHKIEYK